MTGEARIGIMQPDPMTGKRLIVIHDRRITFVWLSFERVHFRLKDGCEFSAPLRWFPSLMLATAEQAAHWVIDPEGTGVHWPDVDEDISLNVLLGLPS